MCWKGKYTEDMLACLNLHTNTQHFQKTSSEACKVEFKQLTSVLGRLKPALPLFELAKVFDRPIETLLCSEWVHCCCYAHNLQ